MPASLPSRFAAVGWDDEALRGAVAIYDGPWALLAQLDRSLLAAGGNGTQSSDGRRIESVM